MVRKLLTIIFLVSLANVATAQLRGRYLIECKKSEVIDRRNCGNCVNAPEGERMFTGIILTEPNNTRWLINGPVKVFTDRRGVSQLIGDNVTRPIVARRAGFPSVDSLYRWVAECNCWCDSTALGSGGFEFDQRLMNGTENGDSICFDVIRLPDSLLIGTECFYMPTIYNASDTSQGINVTAIDSLEFTYKPDASTTIEFRLANNYGTTFPTHGVGLQYEDVDELGYVGVSGGGGFLYYENLFDRKTGDESAYLLNWLSGGFWTITTVDNFTTSLKLDPDPLIAELGLQWNDGGVNDREVLRIDTAGSRMFGYTYAEGAEIPNASPDDLGLSGSGEWLAKYSPDGTFLGYVDTALITGNDSTIVVHDSILTAHDSLITNLTDSIVQARQGNRITTDAGVRYTEWGESTRVPGPSDFVRNAFNNLTTNYYQEWWAPGDTSIFVIDGNTGFVGVHRDAAFLATNPAEEFNVSGNIGVWNVSSTNVGYWDTGNPPTSTNSAHFGYRAGRLNNGNLNSAFGYNALAGNSTTPTAVSAFGNSAGISTISLTNCTFLGYRSGDGANNSSSIVGVGVQSARTANSDNSQFIGANSGQTTDDVDDSQGLGSNSLTGGNNLDGISAIGKSAAGSLVNSTNSVFFGNTAGNAADSIHQSFLMGFQSAQGAENLTSVFGAGSNALRRAKNLLDVSVIGGGNSAIDGYNIFNTDGQGEDVLQGASKVDNSLFHGTQTGKFAYNWNEITVYGAEAGCPNGFGVDGCRDTINKFVIRVADMSGEFLTSADIGTFITAMNLSEGDRIYLFLEGPGETGAYVTGNNFAVYNTDSIRLSNLGVIPPTITDTIIAFASLQYKNSIAIGYRATFRDSNQIVLGNDAVEIMDAGNYTWNIDQDTTGQDDAYMNYNASTNELELEPIATLNFGTKDQSGTGSVSLESSYGGVIYIDMNDVAATLTLTNPRAGGTYVIHAWDGDGDNLTLAGGTFYKKDRETTFTDVAVPTTGLIVVLTYDGTNFSTNVE